MADLRYEATEYEGLVEVIGLWPDGRLKVTYDDPEVPAGYVGRWRPREFARRFTWPGAAAGEPRPDGWIDPNDIEALLAAAGQEEEA